jgi:CheY-like chemotaxis protein
VLQGLTSITELVANVTPQIADGEMRQEDVDRLLTEIMGAGAAASPASPAAMPDEAPRAPAARRDADETRERQLPPRGYTRLALAPRAPSLQGPRVLVVHEGRERRRQLRTALQRAGCVVLEAADGEAALAYACRLRPDAVVTEVALRGLDGVGLLQALRAEGIVDHVFVYTEQHDETLHEWVRELGAADVLTTDDDVATVATRVCAELVAAEELVGRPL